LYSNKLITFDYNKGDNRIINKDIKPDAKVRTVRLAYSGFVDWLITPPVHNWGCLN
jgi:hypothetical protein